MHPESVMNTRIQLKRIEDYDALFIDGKEAPSDDGEIYNLIANECLDISLSEIPAGISVQLYDRVIGSSKDIFPRYPDVSFKNSKQRGYIATLSVAFFPPENQSDATVIDAYFRKCMIDSNESLKFMRDKGMLLKADEDIYDDIAYFTVAYLNPEHTLQEAEALAGEIAARIENAYSPPNLFLCHASEDKPFVDQLVGEMDKRAIFAWYDKREIFVGDSIVEKINKGLKRSDYLVTVLSSKSVAKPWVVREMSSSLMRQLNQKGIRILPILLETCEVPPLLADIKYADFTKSFDVGLKELCMAIQANAQQGDASKAKRDLNFKA
jgi:hypothetical protein